MKKFDILLKLKLTRISEMVLASRSYCCRSILLLLVATILSLTNGQPQAFVNCLTPLAAYRPGEAMYSILTGQSFVSNRGAPAAIVVASRELDVSKAVRCAHVASLKVCARSGGHALDGRNLCQDGVMIALHKINYRSVDAAGIATIGAGTTLGEAFWTLHKSGRWFSGGVCPGVGVGGYLLGGGHGPYEGSLGLGCDAIEEVSMVTRDGYMIKANASLRQDLFWAMCGAGGSQFGIITEFKLRTSPSAPFDRAVVFRFKWPHHRIGELLEKYVRYDADGGDTWVRMVMAGRSNGMTGFGACFNVDSVENCMQRLRRAEFFNIPERIQTFIGKAKSAVDVSAFFGPEGKWGNKFAPDLWRAMNAYRFKDAGKGNEKSDQSAYLSLGSQPPSVAFWQKFADFCGKAIIPSNKWRVCQINMFKNAVRLQKSNAFPFRNATILAHFEMGSTSSAGRTKLYNWMKNHFAPYTVGVYVNYQDPRLKNSYPQMYWGKSLMRLRRLKTKYDPDLFFANPQPLPPLQDYSSPSVLFENQAT